VVHNLKNKLSFKNITFIISEQTSA